MALTDDQKAMLKLLAQREEGYEDMAAVMGISVEEVRKRVKEALSEVDEPEAPAGKEPEVSAPTPPPPAETPPPAPQEQPAPATEAAPKAPAPTTPAPASEPPQPASETAPTAGRGKRPPRLPTPKLPKDRGALIGLAAGALVVVIFAIVLIVSGGGDGSDSSTTAAEGGQEGTTTTAAGNPNLTQAILEPVDGGDASGNALFGRFKKKVLLQVTAKGLEPSRSGQSYAIWLSHSGKAMVPVGTAKVPDSGDLAARFQIPAAVLVLVARSAFNEVDLTVTSDATLTAAIAKARKSKTESAYTGTDVLRGKITGPFVGASAKK